MITVSGEEAHHALRVKRLEVGDGVELCDGRGLVAQTKIAKTDKTRDGWVMGLEVVSRGLVPVMLPEVVVASAVPKGDRLEWMIDGLSQVGAAAWRPMGTKRSVVDPREGKLERMERVAVESMKQCGRAHVMRLDGMGAFKDVVSGGGRVVIADASGGEYEASGGERVVVLIGPEGGWDAGELELARAAGAQVARFGPHVMRTEVAAVVAAAEVIGAERRFRGQAV